MLRRAASTGAYGGGWRGMGPCTESLGSETGDVGGDAEIDSQLAGAGDAAAEEEARAEDELRQAEDERPRRLPPPMPRAAEGAFMRAERRGGRLILTEVRAAEQPRRVVFRASRDGGRLRLQFAAAEDEAKACPRSPDGEPGAKAADNNGGGCCGGAGEFSGRGRVDVGAVVGI